jgi:hypothetical protein
VNNFKKEMHLVGGGQPGRDVSRILRTGHRIHQSLSDKAVKDGFQKRKLKSDERRKIPRYQEPPPPPGHDEMGEGVHILNKPISNNKYVGNTLPLF